MSDLEYLGYIGHPHTSAGRVPTDLGYRFYLDALMELEQLSLTEKNEIRKNLDSADEADQLLKESSRLLGKISRQLCVVTPPHFSEGTFEKLELVQILSNRIIVILSIKSGLVRTIMMEVATEIQREKLEDIARSLNERLSGLTLNQIRETFSERVKDVQNEETGLIRLFIESVDKLFVPARPERLHIAGAGNVIDQPEFTNPQDFRSVIELINNEEIIIHVLEKHKGKPTEVRVTIGEENADEKLKQYSVITAAYSVGDATGSIGVIGPKRMLYPRMIPLVDYVAKTVSEMFTNTNQSP
jgi:heat-inducible transcriptional repressor